jgi:hypothetical protein
VESLCRVVPFVSAFLHRAGNVVIGGHENDLSAGLDFDSAHDKTARRCRYDSTFQIGFSKGRLTSRHVGHHETAVLRLLLCNQSPESPTNVDNIVEGS